MIYTEVDGKTINAKNSNFRSLGVQFYTSNPEWNNTNKSMIGIWIRVNLFRTSDTKLVQAHNCYGLTDEIGKRSTRKLRWKTVV